MRYISVRGAREHNLKNINVDLPRDQMIVITGLSGSGKSSLAFDTIYAEGQRRYVESLSAYARQFLEMARKPDVDAVDGLSPAISIEQKTSSRNPRSTVGTVTEIYDYMRLLWARIGVAWSPTTGLPIKAQTVSQMVDQAMKLRDGTRFYVLAPVVRDRKGEHRKELRELRRKGFQRVKVDGTVYTLDDVPALNKKVKHAIDVVVDRLRMKAGIESRLAEAFEQALALANGVACVENTDSGERQTFSAKLACPVSGFSIDEIEPRLFSFNSHVGACPACDGLGVAMVFEPDLVIQDPSQSLAQGAIAPWGVPPARRYWQALADLCARFGHSMDTPWAELPQDFRHVALFGDQDGGGVINDLSARLHAAATPRTVEELSRYRVATACTVCGGKRLKPEALAVKVGGRDIAETTTLPIDEARAWFAALPAELSDQHKTIAAPILKEIDARLKFLSNVGLNYLTLSRASASLSGGESQRIRLASQIGSGLVGVLYVLDEPSIGLHQRDNNRLLEALKRLRDLGNTVVMVEHDEDAMRAADHLIDMGPGAGVHGGTVVAEGKPAAVINDPNSLTGRYLSGKTSIPVPAKRLQATEGRTLRLVGARTHNLKNVTATIPLGVFSCVTGVSGGGKSSLVIETLYKALARTLHASRDRPGPHDCIEGVEMIDKIVNVDQSPIGRTPRSNPATYTGAFGPIREWFAQLPAAKARGYRPGRFSFNVKGGRCEACQGDGVVKVEMHFLPDVYVTCDVCKGRRYNRETLEIDYRGQSIADVLDMTCEQAEDFFQAIPAIHRKIAMLNHVGLGYVRLGQQATTLSGGEAQRVKLARELARRSTGATLYILDEPTTGLHFEDVRKLLEVLRALVARGDTVVVIEHNLEVIKTADWIIDLGPEGGAKGGHIVAQGTPEQVAAASDSVTGQYLAPYLRCAVSHSKSPQPALSPMAARAPK